MSFSDAWKQWVVLNANNLIWTALGQAAFWLPIC